MQVQSIVHQLLQVVCADMHRVRRASLAASVLGALRSRRLTVTAIGRALPGGTSQKHGIKRADRLLSNRHLQAQRVKHYQGLCRSLIGAHSRPVLLVDWSDLDAYKRHYLLLEGEDHADTALLLVDENSALFKRVIGMIMP